MRNPMKLAALAISVALLPPSTASAQFEGVITVVTHDKKDGDMTMVQWLRGNQFRNDMSKASKDADGPGNASMIIDRDAKTTMIVMHDRRMYMMSKISDAKPPAMKKPEKDEDAEAKWTKTGRTETVAGVSCDVYRGVTVEDGKRREGELCLAKGVGFMPGRMVGSGPMGESMGLFAHLNAPADAGIMKMTSFEGGKPRVEMEVTKVERRKLSDSDFQAPAGYQTFARPGGRKPS